MFHQQTRCRCTIVCEQWQTALEQQYFVVHGKQKNQIKQKKLKSCGIESSLNKEYIRKNNIDLINRTTSILWPNTKIEDWYVQVAVLIVFRKLISIIQPKSITKKWIELNNNNYKKNYLLAKICNWIFFKKRNPLYKNYIYIS